jgi:protein-tyrosine phosphatase
MTDPAVPYAPLRVLFVCTGNICRSPTAEGVLRHLVANEGLGDRVIVDSAGTHGYHVGNKPDRRSMVAAARRGYDLSGLRARKIASTDFIEFDYLLAMDREHVRILESSAPREHREKIAMLLDFSRRYGGNEVPDPYYGGPQGFEHVLDLIEDGAEGLLEDIKRKLGF